MTLEEELELSYYTHIADIDKGVCLVQDSRDKKIYVKKLLPIYKLEIYESIRRKPVKHVPAIKAMAENGGLLILVEEYIPGDTLQEILEQKGCFSEAEAVDILLQLCSIIESFHNCTPPIVNRDIKPSNIKLTPDGIVKLIDLNAAKRFNSEQSKDTVLIGTEGYAAPEQYGFGASGVQTDIYALGVLLNVLVTGVLPEAGLCSGRLRQIVKKCTELNPKNRFPGVSSLMRALSSVNTGSALPAEYSWRRFLPPGFRSANPLVWLASAIGYTFFLSICLTLEVKDGTALVIALNRAAVTMIFLAIVFFSGDYLSVQSRFAYLRNKGPFLKAFLVLLSDAAIAVLGVMLLTIVMSFL